MQARFVILQVLLESGDGLVKIEQVSNVEDGKADLLLTLDRSKIQSNGKKAIEDFLRKLQVSDIWRTLDLSSVVYLVCLWFIQVYKATGDYEQAKKMYDHYSEVSDNSHPCFLSLRSIVLDRKQPRKMFVQGNTKLSGTLNTKP